MYNDIINDMTNILCPGHFFFRSLLTLYLFLIHVLGKVNSAKIKQQF